MNFWVVSKKQNMQKELVKKWLAILSLFDSGLSLEKIEELQKLTYVNQILPIKANGSYSSYI